MSITVLLVDDEKKLLEALSNYLESKGIKVITATSSKEALLLLTTIIPDLLIVDILMPYQSGYEFISEIRRNKQFIAIPFIFLTAKGMTKDRIQGYRLGCRAYITKPFDPEELISVIENIILEFKDLTYIREIKDEIKRIRNFLENQNTLRIQLTPKEKTILFHLIQGSTNDYISKKMKVSTRNIEKYITRLFNKTNTHNRIQLIKHAYKFLRANDENRTRE